MQGGATLRHPLNPAGAEETLISSILPSLHARGAALAVEQIVPLRTDEYPTPAQLPRNSRIDLTRLHQVFGLTSPTWQAALAPELDQLAGEMRPP
jgi:dTDP-4-dehydrorhamnose reductase